MGKNTAKRIFALMILGLFIFSISLSFVGAIEPVEWSEVIDAEGFGNTVSTFFNWLVTGVVPEGAGESNISIAIGIIALIMIFVIILDVFQLVLPFSDWVTYVLAIGFTIVMLMIGFIRTIAGWGLTIGAYITGGAGVLALVMTAVIFLLAIIFLFFGGQWIQVWLIKMKARRIGLAKFKQMATSAADIKALRELAKEATGPI